MVLSEPRGVVAVVHENVADRAGTLGHDGGVARVSRGELRNVAHTDALMVAAGEKRSTSRGTQCGGMELVIPQTALRQPIEGRRWNWTAEGTSCAKTSVIGHDEQDIGGTCRGTNTFWEVWRRVTCLAANDAPELGLRHGKHSRTSGWRCAWVGRRGLLSKRGLTSRYERHGKPASAEKRERMF